MRREEERLVKIASVKQLRPGLHFGKCCSRCGRNHRFFVTRVTGGNGLACGNPHRKPCPAIVRVVGLESCSSRADMCPTAAVHSGRVYRVEFNVPDEASPYVSVPAPRSKERGR